MKIDNYKIFIAIIGKTKQSMKEVKSIHNSIIPSVIYSGLRSTDNGPHLK
jgi:hypothetical protein